MPDDNRRIEPHTLEEELPTSGYIRIAAKKNAQWHLVKSASRVWCANSYVQKRDLAYEWRPNAPEQADSICVNCIREKALRTGPPRLDLETERFVDHISKSRSRHPGAFGFRRK